MVNVFNQQNGRTAKRGRQTGANFHHYGVPRGCSVQSAEDTDDHTLHWNDFEVPESLFCAVTDCMNECGGQATTEDMNVGVICPSTCSSSTLTHYCRLCDHQQSMKQSRLWWHTHKMCYMRL